MYLELIILNFGKAVNTLNKILYVKKNNKINKAVLEPRVSPDLAKYIYKQIRVIKTMDLVMSP